MSCSKVTIFPDITKEVMEVVDGWEGEASGYVEARASRYLCRSYHAGSVFNGANAYTQLSIKHNIIRCREIQKCIFGLVLERPKNVLQELDNQAWTKLIFLFHSASKR